MSLGEQDAAGGSLGREAESHLRSILATVPDAMVVIDEKGLILSFSAAAETMFGFSEEEILGENVSVLMPSPDREQHDSYLESYLLTGRRRIIGIGRVTTARHRNGRTFPIELSVGEAFSDGRRIFTGFIRDLTERQQTELRLQDIQAELAHAGRVSAMGSLASAIAHELNQPLTAVANYVEAARDLLHEPDAETLAMVREALDDAARQAVRAGQIVRRLRDFITHGETERRVESLPRLINEANALALVGTGEHGIDVQVKLDPEAGAVLVDRIQIQQVLLNLIRNAIEAMVDSRIRELRIETRRERDGQIRVTVADTGGGLSDEVLAELFHPFVSTKASGMGLGLSICKTIVEAHGGRIWCDTGRAAGTSFHFTLPDAKADEDE